MMVRGVPLGSDLVRGVPVRGVPRPPKAVGSQSRGVAISSGGSPGAQISSGGSPSGGSPNPRRCYGAGIPYLGGKTGIVKNIK